MNVGNKDWPKPNYLCKCSSCGAQFAGPKRAPLCWGCWEGKSFERNLENGKLTAERDRLREALVAEQSARDAFQNEMVAREVFMDAGKDTYQASLDAWDEAKRRVEPTREIADKLRAEALKP